MRILGLDFGDKTIGVAVSDPFGWTAQGVEIIRRENSMEFKKCMRRLAELVEQYLSLIHISFKSWQTEQEPI